MKRYLKLLVLVISIFFLTACFNNKILTGKYKIVRIKENGEVIKLEKVNNETFDYTLEIKKDNTAILVTDVGKEELKYDGKYFYSSKNKNDKVTYTYKNGKIILRDKELTMEFEKE